MNGIDFDDEIDLDDEKEPYISAKAPHISAKEEYII